MINVRSIFITALNYCGMHVITGTKISVQITVITYGWLFFVLKMPGKLWNWFGLSLRILKFSVFWSTNTNIFDLVNE